MLIATSGAFLTVSPIHLNSVRLTSRKSLMNSTPTSRLSAPANNHIALNVNLKDKTMNEFTRLSSTLAAFKAGTLTELEAVMGLQIREEGTLQTLTALSTMNQELASLPVWKASANPIEPQEVVLNGDEDDESCRVWLLISTGLEGHNDQRVMLTERAPGIHNAGQWCFPGGHKLKKETPYQGAAREAEEEVGVKIDQSWTQLLGVYPDKHGVIHYFYAVNFPSIRELKVAGFTGAPTEEVSDFQFYSAEEIVDCLYEDRRKKEKADRKLHKSVRQWGKWRSSRVGAVRTI